MFSSLLPRPKHSNYDPKLHYRIPAQAELSNAIQVQHDETSITTLSTIHQLSNNSSKTYDATIPLKVRFPNLIHNFPRPPPYAAIIEETRAVLTALLEAKLGTQKKEQTSYMSYNGNAMGQEGTTNDGDDNDDTTAAHDGKIIQIETMQEDPLLPPKHKLRKNRHQRHDQEQEMGPILKKSAKVSKEDRQKWNIPAAISNWKNNSGFTIALDKRVIGAAAGAEAGGSGSSSGDGGSLNVEKFGALNKALNQAEVQAREDITRRNELRQQLEMQEKRQREEKIREIANRSKKRRY
ncbi:PRP45 [Candida metapsilosis]|uniref:Pre-mRNA-processing protein 45 n=1 Tax=Candida metapsilosis TaxID=273372 RepID=A0A8H7ZJ09_9ASCO|nr:PRP45 [Candida metapsilosis]